MRILVCSDSHHRADLLALAYDQQPRAEALVFLGDGMADTGLFRSSGKPHYLVSGNCDASDEAPSRLLFTLAKKKIFITHGHEFSVKFSLDELLHHAKLLKANIVLYGHTHMPKHNYVDGIHLFNPGAIKKGCYGFVDITSAGIVCQHLNVRR